MNSASCVELFLALHGWIRSTGEKLHDNIAENRNVRASTEQQAIEWVTTCKGNNGTGL